MEKVSENTQNISHRVLSVRITKESFSHHLSCRGKQTKRIAKENRINERRIPRAFALVMSGSFGASKDQRTFPRLDPATKANSAKSTTSAEISADKHRAKSPLQTLQTLEFL